MWPGIAFSPPTRYASDGTDPAGFARSLTVSSRTTPCDGTSGGSRRDLTVLPHVGFALPILHGGPPAPWGLPQGGLSHGLLDIPTESSIAGAESIAKRRR